MTISFINIEKTDTGYLFMPDVIPYRFEIMFPRFTDYGNISALLGIYRTSNGHAIPVHYSSILLTSIQARDRVVQDLREKDPNVPWDNIISKLFLLAINKLLEPPQLEKLKFSEAPKKPLFYAPVVAENGTLIYGRGSAGKSLFALFLAICLQNGIGSDFGFEEKQTNVLYLDWESESEEASPRASDMVRGLCYQRDYMQLDLPYHHYDWRPLKLLLPDLVHLVKEEHIELIVIDSVIPALGGDPADPGVVNEFFTALRRLRNLGVRYLLISHVTKTERTASGETTPYGSVFFENFPRLTWEARSVAGDHEIAFGLFPRKCNFGKLRPLGFKFIFENGMTLVEPMDTEALTPPESQDALETSILNYLIEHSGTATLKELTKDLDLTKVEAYRVLQRLIVQGKVVQPERGKYELAEKQLHLERSQNDVPPF
ncbi:MAG: AAA family ATPase [Candidatus Methanosuratincola sp.]